MLWMKLRRMHFIPPNLKHRMRTRAVGVMLRRVETIVPHRIDGLFTLPIRMICGRIDVIVFLQNVERPRRVRFACMPIGRLMKILHAFIIALV